MYGLHLQPHDHFGPPRHGSVQTCSHGTPSVNRQTNRLKQLETQESIPIGCVLPTFLVPGGFFQPLSIGRLPLGRPPPVGRSPWMQTPL